MICEFPTTRHSSLFMSIYVYEYVSNTAFSTLRRNHTHSLNLIASHTRIFFMLLTLTRTCVHRIFTKLKFLTADVTLMQALESLFC